MRKIFTFVLLVAIVATATAQTAISIEEIKTVKNGYSAVQEISEEGQPMAYVITLKSAEGQDKMILRLGNNRAESLNNLNALLDCIRNGNLRETVELNIGGEKIVCFLSNRLNQGLLIISKDGLTANLFEYDIDLCRFSFNNYII